MDETSSSVETERLKRAARILERKNATLEDRVRRLESVLRDVHGTVPRASSPDGASASASSSSPPLPPWAEETSPLLLAYDRRIRELKDALGMAKDQMLGFTSRMQAATDENVTLRAELKQYVAKAIDAVDGAEARLGGGSGISSSASAAVEIRELVEQLEVANETVDMVSDSNSALEAEVSELRGALADAARKLDAATVTSSDAQTSATELRRHNVQLEEERKSAEAMLQDMSALRTRLQANLAREREESVALTQQRDAERETTTGLKQSMETTAGAHAKEINAADALRRTHVEHIEKLRAEVDAAARERVALSTEHGELVKQHNVLRSGCSGMLEDLTRYEKELGAFKQVEEQTSAREADAERVRHECALLQEQAEVRATRSRKESDRLRQVLKTAGADALRREQYLVAQERARLEKQLEAREAELQLVLQRCETAEAKFERSRREKASSEASVTRLNALLVGAQESMQASISDIVQRRASKEEEGEQLAAAADAAREQLQRVQHEAQRKETRHRDAMRSMTQKNEALRVQIDELSARSVRIEAQLSDAVQRTARAEGEKDDAARRVSTEFAAMKQVRSARRGLHDRRSTIASLLHSSCGHHFHPLTSLLLLSSLFSPLCPVRAASYADRTVAAAAPRDGRGGEPRSAGDGKQSDTRARRYSLQAGLRACNRRRSLARRGS
tara:strand:- start:466 stop:2514 length:2049 start_codon:yes stop_codon:yes gene_type:complete